jgi:methionine aminopeptidase
MGITIKTDDEIGKMRVAGRLAAEVLHMIRPHVQPGITTGELDRICHDYIVNEQQAIPAPLNYRGFPKSICTSINHQVCSIIRSAMASRGSGSSSPATSSTSTSRSSRTAITATPVR